MLSSDICNIRIYINYTCTIALAYPSKNVGDLHFGGWEDDHKGEDGIGKSPKAGKDFFSLHQTHLHVRFA